MGATVAYPDLRSMIPKAADSPVILAIALLGAVASAYGPLVQAYKAGHYTQFSLWLLTLLLFLFLFRKPSRRSEPLVREHFEGPSRTEMTHVWPRGQEVQRITQALRDEETAMSPLVLVGPSGVGKSHIVETELPQALTGWRCALFYNYRSISLDVSNKLSTIVAGLDPQQFALDPDLSSYEISSPTLLVFDQAEQLVTWGSPAERQWMAKLLRATTSTRNLRVIIVVRKDWYYEVMLFLEENQLVPFPRIDLIGIPNTEDDIGRRTLLMKFYDALDDEASGMAEVVLDDLTKNNSILPIEAQIVGLTIENMIKRGESFSKNHYLDTLEGKQGLVRRYFEMNIDASPDPKVALPVLFALTAEMRLRSPLNVERIANLTHHSPGKVEECARFFHEQKILDRPMAGHYMLSHDYLSERIYDLSGTLLDPVVRDNIAYFANRDEGALEDAKFSRPQREFENKLSLSEYLFPFLAAVLFARLFSPIIDFGFWGSFDPFYDYSNAFDVIDLYFIPVFLSTFLWMIFSWLTYRRVFSWVVETRLGVFLRRMIVPIFLVGGAAVAFVPYLWLCLISFAGILIGVRVLSYSWLSGRTKISQDFFRTMGGKLIMLNSFQMIIAISIGVIFRSQVLPDDIRVLALNGVLVLGSVITLYFSKLAIDVFAGGSAPSRILGLIDRGSIRPIQLQ